MCAKCLACEADAESNAQILLEHWNVHTLESTAGLQRLLYHSEMKGSGLFWAGLGWLRCWEMQSKEAVKRSLCTGSINTHEWRLAPLCLRQDQVTTAVSDIMPDVFQGACCPPLGIPRCAYHLLQAAPLDHSHVLVL